MALAFIRNLVGVKTDRAVQSGLEALVRWDPQSATEAELRTMEQNLDGLGMQVAEARRAFDKEQREAAAIVALSNQRMAAAEHLQRQMEAADPAQKASIEASLNKLIGMLEEMAPEIEREKQEAADARDFLEMLESTYNEAGNKLKSARSALTKAQRDMSRAEQQRNMAERREEAARQAAGLAGATSGLTVALKAMQDAAAKDLAHADAAAAKAKLLTPSRPEQEDPNIAAALAAASGAGPKPTSAAERLAALRSKMG